ncbi:MAG: lysylphosphatidylglycerol synthase domain-containing protein [Dongiaceae bacterium]
MRKLTVLALFLGLAAVAAMVARQDAAGVAAALVAMGAGILLLPLAYAPHFLLAGVSWRLLFRRGRAAGFWATMGALWMGLSVETLLPVASIGGEVVKARVVMRSGVSGADATASVVVDKTVQAVSLILWGLVGVAALAWVGGGRAVMNTALSGIALLTAGVAGFIVVQRVGMFGILARVVGKATALADRPGLAGSADGLDAAIGALYRRPGPIVAAGILRLAASVALTAEILLAAYLMGHPLRPWDALILQSLTSLLRGATFVVPNGWGVQEGGYLVLGGVIGLSPELMLAVSLATRARDLLVSAPGLLAWQLVEGRSLWRRR